MSFLMTILEKTGLVVSRASNVQPGQAVNPAEVQITTTRVVSLKELVHSPTAQITGPKGFKATPEDVFDAAHILPVEGGWTIERFAELAKKAVYRDMAPETKQKALLGELATQKVDPTTIVEDAVRKDEALDAYERFLTHRLAATRKEAAERVKKLKEEALAVEKAVAQTEADFQAWLIAKKAKEQELAAALEPIVKGKITTS